MSASARCADSDIFLSYSQAPKRSLGIRGYFFELFASPLSGVRGGGALRRGERVASNERSRKAWGLAAIAAGVGGSGVVASDDHTAARDRPERRRATAPGIGLVKGTAVTAPHARWIPSRDVSEARLPQCVAGGARRVRHLRGSAASVVVGMAHRRVRCRRGSSASGWYGVAHGGGDVFEARLRTGSMHVRDGRMRSQHQPRSRPIPRPSGTARSKPPARLGVARLRLVPR